MVQKRLHTLPVQLRAEQAEDGAHVITGYASVFESLSEELIPGVRERIERGAFTEALKTSDVRALFNHDESLILGRTSAGTLKLEQDAIGLRYEIKLPDTTVARDLLENIRVGNIKENSFAFSVRPEDVRVERLSDTEAIEVITRVDRIWDVSPVSYPAYPQAFISGYRKSLIDTDPSNAESRATDAGDSRLTDEANNRNLVILAATIAALDLKAKSIEVEI